MPIGFRRCSQTWPPFAAGGRSEVEKSPMRLEAETKLDHFLDLVQFNVCLAEFLVVVLLKGLPQGIGAFRVLAGYTNELDATIVERGTELVVDGFHLGRPEGAFLCLAGALSKLPC